MIFSKKEADIYIPDQTNFRDATHRTTHLAIGAHQDDLEIFAYHGIASCFEHESKSFGGITITNGSGSSRTGEFADHSDKWMMALRREEQRKAADLGKYSFVVQLDYESSEVKDGENLHVSNDILKVLSACSAETIYLHNPADKHPTHIGVLKKSLDALRKLPNDMKPKKLYACEVWRDLDWLLDEDKVALDVSLYPDLASELLKVFRTQIAGGKRYDLATLGRRRANATYYHSHAADSETELTWAIDLMPLLKDPSLTLEGFTLSLVDRFRIDIKKQLKGF